ncbi:MAG: hypothetical protein H6703_11415 [Myxococcales bacterium]|nr:hypothetical protein [Myxococcales bacterium]
MPIAAACFYVEYAACAPRPYDRTGVDLGAHPHSSRGRQRAMTDAIVHTGDCLDIT